MRKLKNIWRIIWADEYIVFTVSKKKQTSSISCTTSSVVNALNVIGEQACEEIQARENLEYVNNILNNK